MQRSWLALAAMMAAWLLGAATGRAGAAPWVPRAGEPFDVQLTAPFQLTRAVGVLALGGAFDGSPARRQELRARGVRLACVVNAGAWEKWRPDSGAFDRRLVGASLTGWPGERWLDVRAHDRLRPIMARRLDLCAGQGFDGVLLRNLDGHAHRTGFPLTAEDQLAYNRWIAAEARARGLAVGLMGTLGLAPELVADVDFVVGEGCFEATGCEALQAVRRAGKPAIVVEYTNVRRKMDARCAAAAALDVQLIVKAKSLNGKLHRRCP